MFIIKGKIDGAEYVVRFIDDKETGENTLTGDEKALEKTKKENKIDHGFLGLRPAGVDINYLDDETAAFMLITKYVFDEVIHSEDDWYEGDGEDIVY